MDCLTIFKGTFIRAETLNGFYKYNSFFNDLLFSYYKKFESYILYSNCDLNNNWFAKGNHPPWLVEYIFGIIVSLKLKVNIVDQIVVWLIQLVLPHLSTTYFPTDVALKINQFVSIYIYLTWIDAPTLHRHLWNLSGSCEKQIMNSWCVYKITNK